jgi:hypothetical protein
MSLERTTSGGYLVRCSLELVDVDLLHLEHRGHDTLRLLGVGIA